MASTTQTQDAYAAGWAARQAGVARTDNPFTAAYDASDWNMGWDDAPTAESRVAAEVARYGSARAAYHALTVPFGPVPTNPDEVAFDRALWSAMNGECWEQAA